MIIADKLSDVPSTRSVQTEKDAVSGQLWGEYRKRLAQYEQKHGNDKSKVRDESLRMQGETGINIAKKRWELQSEYDKKKAAQFRLAANISRISPASVYTYAAIGLARTGFHRQEEFLAAARSYQIALLRGIAFRMSVSGKTEDAKFDLDELMSFEFRESRLSESWGLIWADLLILFLLVACFFMIAYVGFVRSDI